MRQLIQLQLEFVKTIPEAITERTLYVSMDYATAVHKCCCGCGREVVTPLSPTDWKLIYDGVTISLSPSIGNWSFPCRSHYWIRQGTVHWAEEWSDERITAGRAHDRCAKDRYFAGSIASNQDPQAKTEAKGLQSRNRNGFWARLLKLWPR